MFISKKIALNYMLFVLLQKRKEFSKYEVSHWELIEHVSHGNKHTTATKNKAVISIRTSANVCQKSSLTCFIQLYQPFRLTDESITHLCHSHNSTNWSILIEIFFPLGIAFVVFSFVTRRLNEKMFICWETEMQTYEVEHVWRLVFNWNMEGRKMGGSTLIDYWL